VRTFLLPDLGEGLPDAEIVKWYVQVGDNIQKDQNLVSVETAKALLDIPSPFTGRIVKLFAKVGELVKTGGPLVEFEVIETLVQKDQGTVVGKLEVTDTIIGGPTKFYTQSEKKTVKATLLVRNLAERLKVDLTKIKPTGPNATVTRKDVELAANTRSIEEASPLLPENKQFIEKLKGARRAMAETMSKASFEVVPVTVMEDVILLNISEDYDITIQVIQAIKYAVTSEPALNAWYDHSTLSRRLMTEINIGVAIDTVDGLFVPVIHQVEELNDVQLRQNLESLKQQINARTIALEDLKGASILLSNFGKFSGRYATPVVVPPTVATLGVGKVREEVIASDQKIQIAKVLPLSLTVDHRAVTGGEATRFLKVIVQCLQKTQ